MNNQIHFFKKSLFIFVFYLFSSCIYTTSINAQFELKANPLALIFEVVNVGVEKPIGDDWGVDAEIFAAQDGFYLTAAGKAYLKPKYGADRFHIGLFAATGTDFGVGAGFLAGYKLISTKGVLLEFGGGIGRGTEGILPYGKLQFGYRFKHGIGKADKEKVID